MTNYQWMNQYSYLLKSPHLLICLSFQKWEFITCIKKKLYKDTHLNRRCWSKNLPLHQETSVFSNKVVCPVSLACKAPQMLASGGKKEHAENMLVTAIYFGHNWRCTWSRDCSYLLFSMPPVTLPSISCN